MTTAAWISQPKLWERAQQKSEREEPKWTRAFWRKVLEIYLAAGGRLEEYEDEIEDEPH